MMNLKDVKQMEENVEAAQAVGILGAGWARGIREATNTIKRLHTENERKTAKVMFTPTHQSYMSAGDDAEPFCGNCEEYLVDDEDSVNYCHGCGYKLDWEQSHD